MSPVLLLLWGLLVHLPGILAIPVLHQNPISGPFSAGRNARLECRLENGEVASSNAYWDRQCPAQRPEWVISHYANDNIHRGTGITDRFRPSRDTSADSFILDVISLEPGDSAVYYCKTEFQKPSILLLPPPQNEIGSGSATLSCLVSGFKPGLVALRWKVDGVETESGVTTGAVPLDTDQTYRLSSYLRVPAAAWNKGSSYSCSVSHSSLSSPLRKTISSSACAE
ncbi:immunoglobulin lambda-1 light chain-like [Hypanus sabinus]|uniref:immunoglobulin lambda-1 light chain-like n=1 Tax=Hypanus sabinus TaxID=79690 RepID=UPI0028C3FC9F|nr:immunoglobulin lambda-1 light chain-like [Hypanus sabinus]